MRSFMMTARARGMEIERQRDVVRRSSRIEA